MLVVVSLAARDATSAISFLIPAIDTVSIGEARWTCWRSANALQRCPPTIDFDDASFVAHATAGVLSQKMPTWACVRLNGLICSSTNQASSTPAISKSDMEIVPFLFLEETKFFWISKGHCILHTVGAIFIVPFTQTPPTPYFDASTYARSHGKSAVSSSTDVGRDEITLSRTIQLHSACLIAGVIVIVSLSPCMALLTGDSSPRPLGSPMQA